ncbi:MAG: NUDIX hydrolase [Saprospiraceae bacterium]
MKIFINEKPIHLISSEKAKTFPKTAHTLSVIYRGNIKLFHQIVDTFEKKNNYDAAIIHANDIEQLTKDFLGIFKIIGAAGGVVFNQDNKILSIFRRGYWDLPKGKIDKGESEPEAALREVSEETGIKTLVLGHLIGTTYHIYTQDKRRILKPTYWFSMKTNETELIPQTEEDIETAVWLSKEELLQKDRVIYRNIVEILNMV